MIVFFLVGCEEKKEVYEEDEKIDMQETHEEVVQEIQQFMADPNSFRYIVDWLSDEEILFVENEAKQYHLKTFNIYTKEMLVIYEEENIMTDALIHPLKTDLLVQTTTSSDSATVKRISLDGVVQNEVTIESSELAIEWNDVNPSLMLLNAFYEDWSFDTFFFDGTTNDLTLLQTENPFPKWLGEDYFVLPYQDEEVIIHHVETGEKKVLNESSIVAFDTFKESLLLVQMKEDDKMRYTILNQGGDILTSWEMSISTEEVTGNPPQFEWLDEKSLLLLRPVIDGQVVQPMYELVNYADGDEMVVLEGLENAPLVCSPNTLNCLTGDRLEQLIQVENKTKIEWLQLNT